MTGALETSAPAAWPAAARLIARWLDRRERIDALLDTLPRSLAGTERARCQHLVLGVVRHFGRIDGSLVRLVAHPPRFSTRAVLFVAGFELLEAANAAEETRKGRIARIVHHAVEQTKALASPAEARLVNAVVRKLAGVLPGTVPATGAGAPELAEYFSHPEWLVRSWLAQFGPDATHALLEWNQQPARVYARWRPNVTRPSTVTETTEDISTGGSVPPPAEESAAETEARPDFLKPTQWPDFFEVESGRWSEVEPLLSAGKIYLQDPATRLPVGLLAPRPGESILDLCAAPGGKSLLIADAMKSSLPGGLSAIAPATAEAPANEGTPSVGPSKQGMPSVGLAKEGKLVAVDLPGKRIERLKENLSRVAGVDVALVQADLLENLAVVLREHGLPPTYDAVLIDVPCSNTGVMRHRVDVKWRLQPGDFKKHPRQQLSLLHAAARLVADGGRLVYATCSIDAEENEHVIREFFLSRAGGAFKLESTVQSQPWVTGHDGGSAFLLRRKA